MDHRVSKSLCHRELLARHPTPARVVDTCPALGGCTRMREIHRIGSNMMRRVLKLVCSYLCPIWPSICAHHPVQHQQRNIHFSIPCYFFRQERDILTCLGRELHSPSIRYQQNMYTETVGVHICINLFAHGQHVLFDVAVCACIYTYMYTHLQPLDI